MTTAMNTRVRTEMLPERIESRINRTETCWLWEGSLTRGYGTTSYEGRGIYVHRLTYTLFVGPIPEGYQIDHLCRVTRCCNPEHLEPVTHAENLRRQARDWEYKTHCKRGHARTPENLTGSRNCRKCAALLRISKLKGREFRVLQWNGVERTVTEWAQVVGLSPSTLFRRLGLGWDIERALTEPLGIGNRFVKTSDHRETESEAS